MNRMEITLSKTELERYTRQMLVPDWGEDGQKRLKSARVVVAGVGGLGCPASIYLAVAGIGKLVVIDKEKFELSNLNRQILGWMNDIGRFKAEVAAEKLMAFNPEIEVNSLIADITEENIHELIQDADVVVDAMDNWKARFIINKGCIEKGIPFIHGGIFGFQGQVMTIIPGKSPCLRCLLPRTPKEIVRIPVPGVTPALFASLQVMETLKLIIGFGETLSGKILLFDGESMSFMIVNIEKRPNCPICANL